MVSFIIGFLISMAIAPNGGCPEFSDPIAVGTLKCAELKEVSGLAASRRGTFLWAHNDRGNAARLYAFSLQGDLLAVCSLANIVNNDWEDMAIGPGPEPGINYIYIADTGNNDGHADRTSTVYRLREPQIIAGAKPMKIELNDVERLVVRYPDNLRHDCETLLVDPLNGDIYLCTRDRWNDNGGKMKIYRYPAADQVFDAVFNLLHDGDVQLSFSADGAKKPDWEMAVGGEFSPDGQVVIIRTTSKRKNGPRRVLLWPRNNAVSLAGSMSQSPCVLNAANEEQGEAICFAADGSGFYTVSEGDAPAIYYYAPHRKQSSGSSGTN